MQYFKTLYKSYIEAHIVDCPIMIQEIAILQDTFDGDILGRIKFLNQSDKNIVAVFMDLQVCDIAGDMLEIDNPRYVYQDMIVEPGDVYGNKNAIELPKMGRQIHVSVSKIVFEDGQIWRLEDAKQCEPLPYKKIELPELYQAHLCEELDKRLFNMNYVSYYYKDNEDAWMCSCGRLNSNSEDECFFCKNTRVSQQENLSEEGFKSLYDFIVEKEERKEEGQQIQGENGSDIKESFEKKKSKKAIIIIIAITIAVVFLLIIGVQMSNDSSTELDNSSDSSTKATNDIELMSDKEKISLITGCLGKALEEDGDLLVSEDVEKLFSNATLFGYDGILGYYEADQIVSHMVWMANDEYSEDFYTDLINSLSELYGSTVLENTESNSLERVYAWMEGVYDCEMVALGITDDGTVEILWFNDVG